MKTCKVTQRRGKKTYCVRLDDLHQPPGVGRAREHSEYPVRKADQQRAAVWSPLAAARGAAESAEEELLLDALGVRI